jgi:iron complex outermembrane recepter protein
MRLSITAAACLVAVSIAIADNAHAAIRKPTHIAADGLGSALQALAKERGFQVVYESREVNSHRTQGASGDLTTEEALTQLLSGTGLTYRYQGENGITILPVEGGSSLDAKVASTTGEESKHEASGEGKAGRSFWDRFRLAQVDQAEAGGGESAVKQATDKSASTRQTQRDEPVALEEITVTATKRTEALSKVPISISAFNRDALEASGVKNVVDLAALTPGVEFDNSSGFGPGTLTNIAIRGINSSVGTSTTGIYIDDTPVQSRITALSYFGNPMPLMFDVERVEVDRGPQGTLFGAGAEGGALRFISPDPGLSSYSGFARTELATTRYGAPSYEAGGAAGGPIVADKLGFRGSAWFRRDGGYVDHVSPVDGATVESNSNWTESYAVRGALGARFGDSVKATLSVYDQSIHNNDSSAWFEYLSNPDSGDFTNGRLLRQPSTDKLFLPALKVEADLGVASLTSVTSYVNRRGTLLDDNTSFSAATFGGLLSYGSPRGPEYPTSYDQAVPTNLISTLNQITQEVRLASTDATARLRWTVGLYYSNTRQFDGEQVHTPWINVNFFGVPPDTAFLNTSLASKDKQYAAFGQVDYGILDKLTMTVGLRVARTEAGFTEAQAGLIASPEFPFARGEQKETPVTPRVGFRYELDDDNMVYVSAGKGYRVGGGNLPIPLASPTNPVGCPLDREPGSYQSDSVWSYEAGAKNRLFQGRLRLDTSVFRTDWSNIQQQIFFPSCGFGYTANTGHARVNGFDIGLTAAPVDVLTLGLALAYTDAFFTRDVVINGAPLASRGDVIGNPPGVAAPWSATASAKYEVPLSGEYRAYVRAEDIFHSRNNGPFSSTNPESTAYSPDIPPNPSTNVVNVRMGLTGTQLEVSLFVNNVMDRNPSLTRYHDTPFTTLFTDLTLRPRTAGITASYRF